MNEVIAWNPSMTFLCALAGYLIGNIQTSIIVSELFFHDDVRKHGSGNAGSTNMLRVYGKWPGIVTFVGDFAKAVLAVLLGRHLLGVSYGGYLAGFFVIIGHCWPIFAGFRGGKGVASSCGLAFMVFPVGAAASLAIGIVLLLITKKVSIMSLSAILLFFFSVLLFRRADGFLVLLSALIVVVVYVRHIDNIKRLLHGQEHSPINP